MVIIQGPHLEDDMFNKNKQPVAVSFPTFLSIFHFCNVRMWELERHRVLHASEDWGLNPAMSWRKFLFLWILPADDDFRHTSILDTRTLATVLVLLWIIWCHRCTDYNHLLMFNLKAEPNVVKMWVQAEIPWSLSWVTLRIRVVNWLFHCHRICLITLTGFRWLHITWSHIITDPQSYWIIIAPWYIAFRLYPVKFIWKLVFKCFSVVQPRLLRHRAKCK